MSAWSAAGRGEAMGQDATFEGAATFALDVGRHRAALLRVTGKFKPGRQMTLPGAIEHGAFGLAAAIERGVRGRAGRTGRHDHPDWGVRRGNCAYVQSSAR